jgi:hypothetical protein
MRPAAFFAMTRLFPLAAAVAALALPTAAHAATSVTGPVFQSPGQYRFDLSTDTGNSLWCRVDSAPPALATALDFAACGPLTPDVNGDASVVLPFADGAHTLHVVSDPGVFLAPEQAAPYPLSFTIDETPPTTSIGVTPPAKTNSTSATFTFSGSDAIDGSVDFACKLDTDGAFSAANCAMPRTVTEGQRTFQVRAVDDHGNVDATPASYSWIVDLTKPTISITNPAVRSQDGSQNVLPTYLYESNPPEALTCTDPLAGSPAAAAGLGAGCSIHIDTGTLGVRGLMAQVTDLAGNQSDPVYRTYRVHPPKYGDYVNADLPRVYWRMDDAKGATSTTDGGEYKSPGAPIVLRRDPAISCEARPAAPHRPAGCEVANDEQGYSGYFPGADAAYVTRSGLAATPSYTMEAWINRADSQSGGVMEHGVNNGALYIDGAGHIVFHVQDKDVVGPVIPQNAWRHVAGVFDNSTNTGTLYVNGVSAGSVVTTQDASGEGTSFYVGRTDHSIARKAFHGFIDEAAYYGTALSAGRLLSRYRIGTYAEGPGPAIPPYEDMNRPTIDTHSPANGALYSPASSKTPVADFDCADIEDPAPSCVATVDGNSIADGAALLLTAGQHDFTVTATDASGLVYTHTHRYYVEPFRDLILGNETWSGATIAKDVPTLYYRFDEADSATTAVSQTGSYAGT